MQYIFFSYPKLVNNLEIISSSPVRWFNNLSLLFLAFSFSIFFSYIISFADDLDSLSFSKSCRFHKIYIFVIKSLNLHLTFLRYRLFNHLAYLALFLFHALWHLFLVLQVILVFLSYSIYFLNLFVHPIFFDHYVFLWGCWGMRHFWFVS